MDSTSWQTLVEVGRGYLRLRHLDSALAVLERFRREVEEFSFPQVGQVTISIGYAQIGTSDYPPSVLDKADKALYYAKNTGRNQTCCYETLVAQGDIAAYTTPDNVELFCKVNGA